MLSVHAKESVSELMPRRKKTHQNLYHLVEGQNGRQALQHPVAVECEFWSV